MLDLNYRFDPKNRATPETLESDLSAAVPSNDLQGFQAVMQAIERVTQITVRQDR